MIWTLFMFFAVVIFIAFIICVFFPFEYPHTEASCPGHQWINMSLHIDEKPTRCRLCGALLQDEKK